MVLWIILAYMGASCIASLIVYAACVAAARADKIQQHAYTTPVAHEHELAESRTEASAPARLALTV